MFSHLHGVVTLFANGNASPPRVVVLIESPAK